MVPSAVYTGGASYPTLQNRAPGYFEVWDMFSATTISVGQTVRRIVRVGTNLGPALRGDSTSIDPVLVGSSSAWVTRLTSCTWRVAWYPWAPLETGENAYGPPRIVAYVQPESSRTPVIRLADYSMPLSATVTLIGGVVPGCN